MSTTWKYKKSNMLLGRGTYGKVYFGSSAEDPTSHVALKYISKEKVAGPMYEYLKQEISIQMQLKHLNLVKLISVEETEKDYILVLELCHTDLKTHLREHPGLKESAIRPFFRQACDGVRHLHENKIVHRDLKLEHFLLTSDRILKISDFGFSKRLNDYGGLCSTRVGTIVYMSPEASKQDPYGYDADIWSLGIIFFYLLFRRYPYSKNPNEKYLEFCVRNEDFTFPKGQCSDEALDLLKGMLTRDVKLRITIQDVVEHPWFESVINDEEIKENVVEEKLPPTPIVTPIIRFEEKLSFVGDDGSVALSMSGGGGGGGGIQDVECEMENDKPNPLTDPTLKEYEVLEFVDYPEEKNEVSRCTIC
jgi:5'-AMP-activated protein kinase catalytic alpha subunit